MRIKGETAAGKGVPAFFGKCGSVRFSVFFCRKRAGLHAILRKFLTFPEKEYIMLKRQNGRGKRVTAGHNVGLGGELRAASCSGKEENGHGRFSEQ